MTYPVRWVSDGTRPELGSRSIPEKINISDQPINEHLWTMPDEPSPTHVIVTRIAPGVRTRRFVQAVIFDPLTVDIIE